LRKVTPENQRLATLRRRDTAPIEIAAVLVFVVFALVGSLGFIEALFGSLTLFALVSIYRLVRRTSFQPVEEQADPADQAPVQVDTSSRSMLDQLPIPVLLIDSDGRIERSNPAARQFLGLTSENPHLSLVLRQPIILEAVGSVLQGISVDPVEYSVMTPSESHVRAFLSSLESVDGVSSSGKAMLVLTDETSLKKADRMRADFLANASHELRTPLASLSGFIETLRGHAKDDEAARDRFLSIMEDQADRMRRLIEDLLVLSRVEMDEHVPPSETQCLPTMVEDVLASLRPQIEKRNAEIITELDQPAHAIGDRNQLMEVLQNLLENALKYSPDGSTLRVVVESGVNHDRAERPGRMLGSESSRLTLTSPVAEPGSQFTVVRIRDEGKGIARQNLPRLSERFYRIDGQKSGPKEGTGLGLAIVKHIVTRHRGGMTVESLPGKGSVFSIFLPAPKI
jgi:two-component system phosphate regulon sensor histidine kinase PhoR